MGGCCYEQKKRDQLKNGNQKKIIDEISKISCQNKETNINYHISNKDFLNKNSKNKSENNNEIDINNYEQKSFKKDLKAKSSSDLKSQLSNSNISNIKNEKSEKKEKEELQKPNQTPYILGGNTSIDIPDEKYNNHNQSKNKNLLNENLDSSKSLKYKQENPYIKKNNNSYKDIDKEDNDNNNNDSQNKDNKIKDKDINGTCFNSFEREDINNIFDNDKKYSIDNPHQFQNQQFLKDNGNKNHFHNNQNDLNDAINNNNINNINNKVNKSSNSNKNNSNNNGNNQDNKINNNTNLHNNKIKNYKDYDINTQYYLQCSKCQNCLPFIEKFNYDIQSNEFKVFFICSCDQSNIKKVAFLRELITEYEPRNLCSIHEMNELLFFCKNCSLQICESCKENHQSHLIENNVVIKKENAEIMLKIAEIKKNEFKGYEILKKIFINYVNLGEIIVENNLYISAAYGDSISQFISSNQKNNKEQIQNINIASLNEKPKQPSISNSENTDNISQNSNNKNNNDDIQNFKNNFNDNNFNNNNYGGRSNNLIKEIDPYNIINSKTLEGHTEKVVSLIQLESGYIATGSYDFSIRIWDIEQGNFIITLYDIGYILCLLEFKPNLLLAGTSENVISLWDLNQPNENQYNFNKHTMWVNCLVKCDEQYFASGSNDKKIIIWDYNQRKSFCVLQGHDDSILCMIKLNDGKLCSGGADKTIRIWDWKRKCRLFKLTSHNNWVKCLFQLKDGTFLSGSDDKTIKIWKNRNYVETIQGHDDSIRDLCHINDNFFASGSFDNSIRFWDISTKESVNTLLGHTSNIICLIKLKDNRLVSCSNDKTIKIWE